MAEEGPEEEAAGPEPGYAMQLLMKNNRFSATACRYNRPALISIKGLRLTLPHRLTKMASKLGEIVRLITNIDILEANLWDGLMAK